MLDAPVEPPAEPVIKEGTEVKVSAVEPISPPETDVEKSDSGAKEEPSEENTALATEEAPEDGDSPPPPPPPPPEKPIDDKVAAAISTLTKQFQESSDKPSSDQEIDSKLFITASIADSSYFIVPWRVCNKWESVEALLKLVFQDDKKSLEKINKSEYKVYSETHGIITHNLWEVVVEPKWKVVFELNETAAEPAPEEPEAEVQETKYEKLIKYTYKYQDTDSYQFAVNTYDKPLQFERTDEKPATLPVLEEFTVITSGFDETFEERKKKEDRSRKPKLKGSDRITERRLQIHSVKLQAIISALIEYSVEPPSGDNAIGDGIFRYPYRDLFCHREELEEYKSGAHWFRSKHSDEFNAEVDEHIELLLEYLSGLTAIPAAATQLTLQKEKPTVTYKGLWLLLKPGIDVYVREENRSLNAYVLDKVTGGPQFVADDKANIDATPYEITVWSLVYDGKDISRRAKTIEIPLFDNEEQVTKLQVFPVRFLDRTDGGAFRQRLIDRGKKYFQYCKGPAYLEFTGTGLGRDLRKYKRSRVVVDHSSNPWHKTSFEGLGNWWIFANIYVDDIGGQARIPTCTCKECSGSLIYKSQVISGETWAKVKYAEYDKIFPRETEELLDHQYMLMSSHMFAFSLNDRKWDLLAVEGLQEPAIAINAIDYLVMDPSNKDTVKAIAATYTDTEDTVGKFSADFVRGKGEGQVILLHGPPGTGKTLTAEAIAEYTRRPLLSITGADLGSNPTDIEVNLLQMFKNANEWDAIVLLDEADIYLQRRTIDDLHRNAVVTVFLRALDYFQGILFLTTNRVGQFDEAFMSRIHVAIGYDKLDENAREKIWQNLFNKLEESYADARQPKYEWAALGYVTESEDVKKLEWNGREIRNAFQTAVALAVFEAKSARAESDTSPVIPKLKISHLKKVVGMSSAFRKYMTATHEGLGESDRAYKAGNRHDDPL